MFVLLLLGHVTSTSKIRCEDENVCCVTSCQFDERRATKPIFVARSRVALHLSQELSSTRKRCFCCTQVDHARRKTRNIGSKLATKQYCAASWVFLCLVFRRLKQTSENMTQPRIVPGLQITTRLLNPPQWQPIHNVASWWLGPRRQFHSLPYCT